MGDQNELKSFDEDERGLIQEILSSPESDDARLVYADWLEERGDERGGFIRAELSFAAASTLEDATEGIAFFNSTSHLSLPTEWVSLVGMKFDLRLENFRSQRHNVVYWLSQLDLRHRPLITDVRFWGDDSPGCFLVVMSPLAGCVRY